MARLPKIVTLVLLILLGAGALFAQAQPKKPAWPAYAFSLLFGFGTGQYYLGDNGTAFLIGDVIGLGGIIAGEVVALSPLLTRQLQLLYLSDG